MLVALGVYVDGKNVVGATEKVGGLVDVVIVMAICRSTIFVAEPVAQSGKTNPFAGLVGQ